MKPLSSDDTEAGVGVPQHQDSVGLQLLHQVVGLGDDIAHGLAQRLPHSVQVDVGIGQAQVLEEHAVEVVVIVLTGVWARRVSKYCRHLVITADRRMISGRVPTRAISELVYRCSGKMP